MFIKFSKPFTVTVLTLAVAFLMVGLYNVDTAATPNNLKCTSNVSSTTSGSCNGSTESACTSQSITRTYSGSGSCNYYSGENCTSITSKQTATTSCVWTSHETPDHQTVWECSAGSTSHSGSDFNDCF